MSRVKRSIIILALIVFFMLILPLITIHTVKADAGMLVTLLLFFVVHPAISIAVGILAGKDIKFFWPAPVVVAALFWLFSTFTYKTAFPVVYSAAYLVIGTITMLITWAVTRKVNKRDKKDLHPGWGAGLDFYCALILIEEETH